MKAAIVSLFDSIYKLFMLKVREETRNNYLRKKGVKIGRNCKVHTVSFSTEPYLVEIGDNVRITSGTEFITHDGAVHVFNREIGGGIFGKIKIGNNVFIGTSCIILLNTTIGNNCIVGAGSVVRGQFPDDSVIVGNPAKVVMKTSMQKLLYRQSPGLVKTNNLPAAECTRLIREHFGIDPKG
jgi:acetyltransferase-like isoleucine patch superfamily enzyme